MYNVRIFLRKMNEVPGIASKSAVQLNTTNYQARSFKLQHALVLSKLSRFEYLKRQHNSLTEQQLEEFLRERGTDYDVLLRHHKLHKEFEECVKNTLVKQGVETKVVDRFNYSEEQVSWADMVIAAGGDGTFLLAASRVRDNVTPVVGLNSDPGRSEGRLCLPPQQTANLEELVNKLKQNEFSWKFRSRIRITMKGDECFQSPTELHEQELLEPHHRYFDCVTEQQKLLASQSAEKQHCLPILALNEVFIGERLSARVSYFEMRVDDDTSFWRVKSSGLCVTTGTGSTSWHLSMNRITEQGVNEIIELLKEAGVITQSLDVGFGSNIAEKYNDNLAFKADNLYMCYTIRDLISADVWPSPRGIPPRGLVKHLEVRSRCFDAGLVVDGTVSYAFNDGTNAILEIYPEDSLRTISLI